jgi:hypothetical protein
MLQDNDGSHYYSRSALAFPRFARTAARASMHGFWGIEYGYAPRAAGASACAAFDLVNGDLDDLKETEGIEKWGDVRIRWTWQLDRWSDEYARGSWYGFDKADD